MYIDMKYASILAIIAILLHPGHADLDEEVKVSIENAREKCAEEEPVPPDVLLKIVSNEAEVDKDSQFIKRIFCVGKELKYKNPDGSFNVPMTKEFFQTILGNNQLDEVIDTCMKQVGDHPPSDPLEYTYDAFLCVREILDPDTLYKVYEFLNQLSFP